ncbi:MAG: PilN domain-containing protein [Patescibacteria group bacterium]|nr:PilN domain-containing protein [Patescibacteria group bacterium]
MKIFLNLLSPAKKQALKTAFAMSFVQSLTVYVAIIVIFIAGVLLSLQFTLQGVVKDMTAYSTASFEEYESMTKQMREINDFIRRTNHIHGRYIDWSAVLDTLSHTAPEGIRFGSVTVSADNTIRIEGSAALRDDVLLMKQRLEKLPQFSNISSPLSNILQRENLQFEFHMLYTPQ